MRGGRRLPHAVEVIGFADEEGVRFGTTLLGSRAVAGTFTPQLLDARDAAGITMRQALEDAGLDSQAIPQAARRREEVLAYAELHIEQGPVLEAAGLPVGVVTGINGFTRLRAAVKGIAGHAGTVPMGMRRDALAAAAECVLAVERIAAAEPDLVGTVGRLEALPGAINVIPGEARFTIDVRSPRDGQRQRAVAAIRSELQRRLRAARRERRVGGAAGQPGGALRAVAHGAARGRGQGSRPAGAGASERGRPRRPRHERHCRHLHALRALREGREPQSRGSDHARRCGDCGARSASFHRKVCTR